MIQEDEGILIVATKNQEMTSREEETPEMSSDTGLCALINPWNTEGETDLKGLPFTDTKSTVTETIA